MENNFSNPSLKQALGSMRANQSHENMMKVAQALLNTKVMVPAMWDIEPDVDEYGQLRFKPETKISLMVVQSDASQKFFPVFTDMEEVKKFYQNQNVNCLILTLEQYLPFIQAAKGDVLGIVVDPKGVNVPFKSDFLEGIYKANRKDLSQNTIHKGEKVFLRNPEGGIDDLEAALISSGFHEKAVKRIYLRERVDNLENPTSSHWFIVVDSSDLDTGIFSRIGQACRPVSHGKEMEFMFTNQKLGADVARTSKAIYEKMA